MSLREFITYNPWQKGFSLLFAILIWFTVRQSVENNGGDPVVPEAYSRTFEHLPIRVLTLATDLEQSRVTPGEVTVVLRGRPEVLNRLRPQDVEVYVNLTEAPPSPSDRRPVHVNAPGAQLGSVSPQEVLIERVVPTHKSPRDNP
jgi:YbbR domain-containing protein